MPFSIEQFLDVFRRYNDAIWPAQWVLLGLGVVAVVLGLGHQAVAGRMIAGLLAVLWLWAGSVYHAAFFREINSAALAFGTLFIAQGVLFLWLGVWKRRLVFGDPGTTRRIVGGAIVLYALLVYPVLGYVLGHRYPAAPTFGAPCPTTILTLGLLVWARPAPRLALVVPMTWAVIGTSAAWQLGMMEDLGLLVAALVTLGASIGSGRADVKRPGDAVAGQIREAT
jgi:hypothetical protein